jgi:hypothetical protein
MANNSIEQVTKVLAGLIPEDAQKSVEEAVGQFLENAHQELHSEMEEKLKEAYAEHAKELTEAEKIAEDSYAQAWEIITDLRDRLEIQKEEFDKALEEGYEEAFQMLQEERAKNDTLEVDLYEEYDRKFEDIKSYMVDKLDQFLQLQGDKYYEMARRDVSNDPAVVEHKLAFERVLEVAANYLSDEDAAFATSSKVDGLQKQLDETKGQMKILESKNMRLSMENTKLNEAVRQTQEVINEQVTKSDKKARVEKARIVEGRGVSVSDRQRHKVIAEQQDSGEPVAEHKDSETERAERFVEQVGETVFADWKHLSGLDKTEAE